MKIEAGKDYQTRGGLSAKVFMTFMTNGGESCEAILGAILDRRGYWLSAIWNPDGRLYSLSPSAPSEEGAFDLAPRKRTVYVNLLFLPKELRTQQTMWVKYDTEEAARKDTNYGGNTEVIAIAVPIEIEE